MKEISYMDWMIRYSNKTNITPENSKENLTNSTNCDIIYDDCENNIKE